MLCQLTLDDGQADVHGEEVRALGVGLPVVPALAALLDVEHAVTQLVADLAEALLAQRPGRVELVVLPGDRRPGVPVLVGLAIDGRRVGVNDVPDVAVTRSASRSPSARARP
jgi:hypothetical protein